MTTDHAKIKRVLRSLPVSSHAPSAAAASLIRELLSEIAANEFVNQQKDAAMDAVNAGGGIPDDDAWAALKYQRDRLLEACEGAAVVIEKITVGMPSEFDPILAKLQSVVRDVRAGK